jgi:phage protein D
MPENTPITSARPKISVGGSDDASLAEGLLGLIVAEDTEGLYRCEATFGNWGAKGGGVDYLYFDRQTLDFGKTFQIKLGPDAIFDGRITGLEALFPDHAGPRISVLAEDRFQDLRMTRRTRAFADLSDADVFNRIASDHGLTPSVDVSGPTHKVLSQVNQSDLAFMRDRARAIDAEVWMQGSTLNAKSHSGRGGGDPLRLTYGGNLREFTVIADLAHQRTSVTVSGWDVASKDGVKYEATDSVIQGELNGQTGGASILSSALGARKESVAHTVPFTSGEAQAEAESYFKKMARCFVVGRGVAEADARLRVGAYVELKNVGPLFGGKYYLREVRHLFDGARGIRALFTAERPGLGRP